MRFEAAIDVHVRGIDPEIWQAMRVEAVRRNLSVARLIEMLWKQCDLKPRMLNERTER